MLACVTTLLYVVGTMTKQFNQALHEHPAHRRGGTCSISEMLSELDATNRDQVVAALEDRRVQHAQIRRALETIGYKMAASTVSRHRNGGCSCD